jgi:hypothetical protein
MCTQQPQDQKRQNNDNFINNPSSRPKENSHLGIGTLITLSKLTDEMDPNYVLHALPSQHEERSDKWAQPHIATEKNVDQNEAIFNFLEHSSLILNEWAVSDDGLDYMKLEPHLSTKMESSEKEGDGRMNVVGGKKQVVGQKGKKAKTMEKEMPPSKAKHKSVANFLLFIEKCKIPDCWVLFDVHVNKFNGYQKLFQFLITAEQVSEVEVHNKWTPLGWHQFKHDVLVGTMHKCCEDADWREYAVKTCSLKIWDAIAIHPKFLTTLTQAKKLSVC